MKTETYNRVNNYFDQCDLHYQIHWGLDQNRCANYGFWNKETKNLSEALKNSSREIAKILNVDSSSRILDAGCGVGGPAIELAKFTGCKAEGITLVDRHVQNAINYAKQEGVSHLVNFSKMDFCNTVFDEQMFDAVFALESLCYISDYGDFFKETKRVLKNDGKILIAQFFMNEDIKDNKDLKILKGVSSGWATTDFSTVNETKRKLCNQGFVNVESRNITDNVRPSVNLLFTAFLKGILPTIWHRKFTQMGDVSYANVWAAYYQYLAVKRGLMSYHYIWAKK